jgi:hypothetical protein
MHKNKCIYIHVVNTKEVSAILNNLTRLHKSEEKTDDSVSTLLMQRSTETTPPAKHQRTSPSTSERSEFARKRKAESQIVEELLDGPNQERLSLYRSNRQIKKKISKASLNINICVYISVLRVVLYIYIYIYIHIRTRIVKGAVFCAFTLR